MIYRQTKQQQYWRHFRLLEPGEIDGKIAWSQLAQPPAPVWDAETLHTCTRLYHRYVEPGTGAQIPEAAFCDLPRWVFLEYLIQFCAIRLVGSNAPDLTHLEPMVLSQNLKGCNTPRLHAFAETTTPFFHAILDRKALQVLDCPLHSTLVQSDPTARRKEVQFGCYFGIDYRVLPHAPWRCGTIYLYAAKDLPVAGVCGTRTAGLSEPFIRPRAKLSVAPWDWPLLDQVRGLDLHAQHQRQLDTFAGYPWVADHALHPLQRKRPQAEQVRAFLQGHFAENVSLESLGQQFGVSAFTLLRLFRTHFGLSPHQYQTLLRVTQAKRLLQTGLTIAQAAVETGFCDQTHLTRHFRRVVGLTPGNYQRMQEFPICAA